MKVEGPWRGETDGLGDEERLDTLRPGDAVEVWAEGTLVVSTVFRCRERLDERMVEWCWLFLDDGSLVEISPDGHFRYRQHRIVNQGTALYEELVAQDGAVVRFEERVRAGTAGRRPVHVSLDEKRYRISCTGTVEAERLGEEPELIPWRSFSSRPEENVYFGMVDVEDEEDVVLGLWTTHVCLSFGRAFQPSDITAIYRHGTR